MTELRLEAFGGLRLLGRDGAALEVQRRRLALLVLLASAGDRGAGRDRLLGCLWPDLPTSNGRHALDQALSALRRQCGPDVFLGTDPIRLNPDIIVADFWEFERCAARHDLPGASALCRGPFLEGFRLADPLDFDLWAETERARWRETCLASLGALAEEAERDGRAGEALGAWRQLARLDPLSARAARGVIHGLASTGDTAAALRYGLEYEALVRRELDCPADPLVRGELARIEAELARMAPGAVPPPAGETPAPLPVVEERLPAPVAGSSRPRRRPLVAGLAVALLLVAGAAILRRPVTRATAVPAAPRADEASRLLAHGKYLMLRRQRAAMREAQVVFARAVEADPVLGEAWVRLAASYAAGAYYDVLPAKEGYRRAEAAVRRALALDPTNGFAIAVLGDIAMSSAWDWEAAEREYRRAIRIVPGDDEVRNLYSSFLRMRGRHEEALAEIRAAQAAEPLSRHYVLQEGRILYCADRHEEAIEVFRRASRVEADYADPHLAMAASLAELGRHDEALDEWRLGATLAGDTTALRRLQGERGAAGYLAVRQAEARATLALHALADPDRYVPPVAVAQSYLALGLSDSARPWIARAFDARDVRLLHARCFAVSRPLVLDPTFQALALRHGVHF